MLEARLQGEILQLYAFKTVLPPATGRTISSIAGTMIIRTCLSLPPNIRNPRRNHGLVGDLHLVGTIEGAFLYKWEGTTTLFLLALSHCRPVIWCCAQGPHHKAMVSLRRSDLTDNGIMRLGEAISLSGWWFEPL